MGRNRTNRRDKRKKSDNSDNNDSVSKAGRFSDSPKSTFSVSRLLKETNTVLFDGENTDVSLSELFKEPEGEELVNTATDPIIPTHSTTMASSSESLSGVPTNADILDYLKKMKEEMNSRMGNMEKKLEKIDVLEKKVDSFEKDVTKMWNYIEDQNKRLDTRIGSLETSVESTDFSLGVVNDKVVQLEKDRDSLRDEVVYLQSQSMRNNLVFANIPEAPRGTTEDCEKKLRDFLSKEMKIAQDLVVKLSFERVHRMGQRADYSSANKRYRKIVAKFTYFKDREMVRKQWKALEGTDFYVHEQFPKKVVEKRRKLLPKLKEAKRNDKRAWLSYDTLYIDGKAWKDDGSS